LRGHVSPQSAQAEAPQHSAARRTVGRRLRRLLDEVALDEREEEPDCREDKENCNAEAENMIKYLRTKAQ